MNLDQAQDTDELGGYWRRKRRPYRAGPDMMLDGRVVNVANQRDHVLVEFMAQTGAFPERAEEALRHLWKRRTRLILAIAMRIDYAKSGIDSEGVTNQAFLDAFNNAGTFEVRIRHLAPDERDNAVIKWLGEIVKNGMLDELRRKRVKTLAMEEVAEELLAYWNDPFAPQEADISRESQGPPALRRQWLDEFLATLPARARLILKGSFQFLDLRTRQFRIPESIKENLCRELSITENNLRQSRARLVDALIFELLVRELVHLGPCAQSRESICALCVKAGILDKKVRGLGWFVGTISDEIRERGGHVRAVVNETQQP